MSLQEIAYQASELILEKLIEENNRADIPVSWNRNQKLSILYPLVLDSIKDTFHVKTIIIKQDKLYPISR